MSYASDLDDVSARIVSIRSSIDRSLAKIERMRELLVFLELARDQAEQRLAESPEQ